MSPILSRWGDNLVKREGPFLKSLFSFFIPRDFVSGKAERIAIVSNLLVNIILWVLVLIKVSGGSKPIPLHYSAIYGIDYVGGAYLLFELPAIGLSLFIVNFYLAAHLHSSERFLGRLIIYSSALLQFFLLLAVLGVLYLNR